jgi:ATP-binding cassette subfamily B protein
MAFPFYHQFDAFDCGPTCLKMVSEYFGKKFTLDFLREECFITREGVSLLGVSQAAEKIGFRTLMAKVSPELLRQECPLPAILHWNQEHFVVLYKVKDKTSRFNSVPKFQYIIADPAHGLVKLAEPDFLKYWQTSETNQGVVLLLEPTATLFTSDRKDGVKDKNDFSYIFSYLRPFRKQMVFLTLIMILSLGITVTLPYLNKALIDEGLLSKSYPLILLIVLSQLFLYVTSSFFDVLRGWALLHMNAKISLNIISDFLKKLLKLPIRFFDSKSIGDVTQRINDHHRIEGFLTGDLVSTFFSTVQILVFSLILLSYNLYIWIVFSLFSISGLLWIFLFQKKRMQLDYLKFVQNKTTQEKLFELVTGMQEIKLYGSENVKRWEWEFLQLRQYKLNIKTLKLEQYQQVGFIFFSYLKNVVISFLAAIAVMRSEFSLGVMLSISFIIGQTNGPLQQLIQFFKSAQDAKLSFSRLLEVHQKDNEEQEDFTRIDEDGLNDSIYLDNVSFQYQGSRSPFVLKGINLVIPTGKVTAIVGTSGSGKTTLMKLLLGFYTPTQGSISVGNRPLSDLSPKSWRNQCGTVLQDGYIFYDTIKRNIMMGADANYDQFDRAVTVSNLNEFVEQLPLGFNTKIGSSGVGLSGGQKQRILIARAVFKNPNYLFFDEATSSLDANNEAFIMSMLGDFFLGKTVVIIAHRLSTVKNADRIIVLEDGEVVEMGCHNTLSTMKGRYYELVKNQLELGK